MPFNRNTCLSLFAGLFLLFTSSQQHIMPSEIVDFVGFCNKRKQQIKLSWQTAEDSHTKSYIIERRKPTGEGWDMLGFVPDLGKPAHYDYVDTKPLSLNQYHLRLVDNIGKSTFSKDISISKDAISPLKVYPAIVRDSLMNLEGGEYTEGDPFHIFNMLDQRILSGKTTEKINISMLVRGAYSIQVGTQHTKFLKQ